MTGIQLITAFIDKFLDYLLDGSDYGDLTEKSIEELIEIYDMELGAAKRRWPSLNTGAEWSAMDQWLDERGYTAQK